MNDELNEFKNVKKVLLDKLLKNIYENKKS
jgi:hypothetical protein